MAETSDQVRPLAAASDRPTSSDDEECAGTRVRRRRCVKCCTGVAAVLLIIAIVIVILIFTVFKVKDPIIRLNNVDISQLNLLFGNNRPQPGMNMSLIADVSVKNPNVASFRYRNTTTAVYYRGSVIGEARGPPGRAKARRTMRMNITVEVIADRLLSNPNLASDISSGLLPVNTYTVVRGRVKMVVINKHVTVKMNCSVTINITSRAIQQLKCRRKVKI